MYNILGSSFLWARQDHCCLEAEWLWWSSESLIGLDLLPFAHGWRRIKTLQAHETHKTLKRPHKFTRPSNLEILITSVSQVNTWLGSLSLWRACLGVACAAVTPINPPAGQTGLGWNIFSVFLMWDEQMFLYSLPGKARPQLSETVSGIISHTHQDTHAGSTS